MSFLITKLPFRCTAGACYHALGYHARAVQDYQRAFTAPANPDAPEEEHSQQFLSFYQKEHALWMHSRLDTSIQEFCLDKDLLPSFKVRVLATHSLQSTCTAG